MLRAVIPPELTYTIPNAIDPARFTPSDYRPSTGRVLIVVVTRLVFRKGADLLAKVIPQVCERHPNVDFLIAGDGSKRPLIEGIIASHRLEGRVSLLGGASTFNFYIR